jgi:hypothetical protein
MFDHVFYNNILQAAHNILQANIANVGADFARVFMSDFTPNNQQTMANAQGLFNHVVNYGRQVNPNGGGQINQDQLFQVVGQFVEHIFNQYKQRMAQNTTFGGFNGYQMQPQMNSSGGMFGGGIGGGSIFSQGGRQGGNFGGQPQRPMAGSHLGDDLPSKTNFTPTPTASKSVFAPDAPNGGPVLPVAPLTPAVEYVTNPLDTLPDGDVAFSNVTAKKSWAGERAKDDRIMIGERIDFKTRDQQFTVQAAISYHQEILDDPMQVLRDFYAVAPNSLLGTVFFYIVNYNHLDVLDVPTKDFIQVRDKCIEAVENDPDGMIHKHLINKLQTMQMGSYRALTNYLVKHVNRALYLAFRLSTKPGTSVQITTFDDLNELLSSSYTSSFTNHPDGRYKLETIVSNAIWNALVKSVDVMFEDGETVPTHAIQSSPAFPYSIDGVYPNKFAIPVTDSPDAPEFMKALNDKVLVEKTYLLSRRRVVITNVTNKTILPSLDKKPKLISTPIADIFHMAQCGLPFSDPNQSSLDRISVEPYASEVHPTDQFKNYMADPKEYNEKEMQRFGKYQSALLPVDQTIFAVQYGVDPHQYLQAVDVFTTIDDQRNGNAVIMAYKNVPSLGITQ